MIKDKIKALILLSGKTQAYIADKHNVPKQQYNLKIARGAFRLDDLINLANDTDTTLAFLNKAGKPIITFDVDDIPQKNK